MTLALDEIVPEGIYKTKLGTSVVVMHSGGTETGMRPVQGENDTVRVALLPMTGVLPEFQDAQYGWEPLAELERVSTLTDVNTDPRITYVRDARVRRLLDLNTGHLPEGMDPTTIEGVVAETYGEYGWWLWVPDDIDQHIGFEEGPIPEEIVTIWRFARERGCDYVLLDRDAYANSLLPHWEW